MDLRLCGNLGVGVAIEVGGLRGWRPVVVWRLRHGGVASAPHCHATVIL